jgi:hypothetical protein
MFMSIGFELVLCAILVISSGISLAIFMDTSSTNNLSTTNQGLVQVAQHNDNGSNDNDKNMEFLF